MEFERERQFEECCEAFIPMVYSVIKRLKLKGDEEEFLQIGRIAIYDAWTKYALDKGDFAPYVYSYILGRLKHVLEKQATWKEQHHLVEPENLAMFLCEESDEEEEYVLMDWIEQSNLTGKEKFWVEEAIIRGCKPSQIANKYGYNIHTVKTWRRNAIKKLQKIYEEERAL